jgi:hypothetical protein
MRLPDDPNKYSSQFKYIELGRWKWSRTKQKMQVSREVQSTGAGPDDYEPKRFPVEALPEYIREHGEEGIYTSIFQYNSPNIHDSTSLGPVYFDIDSGDLAISLAESNKLVDHLLTYIPDSAIRLYFSGGKGFHIECEPLTVGVTPHDELSGVFRFIAEDLTKRLDLQSVDFAVYDKRRMWRAANSRHQSTGLFKVECMSMRRNPHGVEGIVGWAKQPRNFEVPEQEFDPTANRWYREYVYEYEASLVERKKYHQNMLDQFLQQGSGGLREFTGVRELDLPKLRANCSAFRELEKKAREQHTLTHYERLFLCSLLTYTDEGVMYFHQLLSKLDDYNFEVSNAHIEDWIRRREYDIGGRPYTCRKAKEVGINCNCDLDPITKYYKVGDKLVESGETSEPSPVRFAYSFRKQGK